jgi:hypothetical protein
VKIVMTLRTHDQADLADASVAFHLNAGADFVIATDHRSADGTRDVLRAYERAGVLHLIEEDGPVVRGAEWRTRMARLAAVEHGADWVFSADGDEFWWPRGGSFQEVLGAVPAQFGVVRCPWRVLIAHRGRDGPFYERLTILLTAPAPINDPANPFRPSTKIAHRGHPAVSVDRGNNALRGSHLRELQCWSPIEVLHLPVRGPEQYRVKTRTWVDRFALEPESGALAAHYRRAARHDDAAVFQLLHDALTVDDPALERGLAAGSLAEDTRLRDVLRALRLTEPVGARHYALPPELDRPIALPPAPPDDVGFAVERAVVTEAETVRVRRAIDSAGRRVDALERRRSEGTLGSAGVTLALIVGEVGSAELLAKQVVLHLALGVDRIAVPRDLPALVDQVLRPYEQAGRIVRLAPPRDLGDPLALADTARVLDAEWALAASGCDFWLPRGPDLVDVLLTLPSRYGLVRSIARQIVPAAGNDRAWSIREASAVDGPIAVRRGYESLIDLPGWRPFEVFRATDAPTLASDELERRLADGTLVVDERLCAALAAAERERATTGGVVPRVRLRIPDVVEEAAYAVEVAELEPPDPAALIAAVSALEQRIAVLERRTWPRLVRRAAAVLRREA